MRRYESTDITKRFDGKKVYKTTKYPLITPQDSDVILISNDGDTLDNLSFKFYNDPTLWWIIALANNIGKGRLSVQPGLQLRIPVNVSSIITEFHNLNKV